MTSERIVPVSGTEPLEDDLLDEIVGHLEEGGILGYPTETVYGFGGLAESGPLESIGRMKGRGERKGYVMLVESVDSVRELRWTESARALASAFWPGPLTLILADPEHHFPAGVRGADDTVAVRMSPHPIAATIVRAVGRPLISSSANAPGEPPARTGTQVLETARRLGAGAELIVLDAGELPAARPSSIVDASEDELRVLREGDLSARTILAGASGS